jgi:adenosylcobinamide-phosphate synthase
MPAELTPAALPLVLAFAWDVLLGEPPARLHPVVWMGRVIELAVRPAPRQSPTLELLYGAAVAIVVPSLFALAGCALLAALASLPIARTLVEAYLLKSAFALRALGEAALSVRDALSADDLAGARAALRSLCSRDAARLDAPLVAAAAVESVAENASDSVVAPLLAYVLLGLPGALFYRAVNTMDAMIGYHGRYEYLGKAAARLDDALNLVPARLTADLLLLVGWQEGRDARRAAAVRARDAAKTASPNAGHPMATMAGLLGVQLTKPAAYRLGDAGAPVDATHVDQAWRLTTKAAVAMLLLALAGAGLRRAVAL